MKFSSRKLENLVESLATLPSIGKKSALRLALHLLDFPHKIDGLKLSLDEIKDINRCAHCHNYADQDICDICADESRKKRILCVVESAVDVMAIEETQQFRGLFHVLGGVINPLEGVGPDRLNIDSLVDRVKTNEVEEVIMAISPTIEGDTTIYYLSKRLQASHVKISQIARGVSFGGELEYADSHTLGRSIHARTLYDLTKDN